MPMGIAEFREAEETMAGPSVKENILTILREDPDNAYSTKELAEKTGKKAQTINQATGKMAEAKILDRKKINGQVFVQIKEDYVEE